MNQAPPSLQDYPGWFPAKLPVWRRKWVQMTTVSLVAFLVGMGVSGSPSTENMMSLERAHTLASRAADNARDEAVADAEKDVLSSPQVLAALEQEREKAKAQLSQADAQVGKAGQGEAAGEVACLSASADPESEAAEGIGCGYRSEGSTGGSGCSASARR